MLSIAAFVVVLGVLIFVHELGHFIAAKSVGIAVLRFSLGFGPITPLRFRRGETEYCVSWFPLGGYVKMAGLEDEGAAGELEGPREEAQVPPERTFDHKSLPARLLVMLAGVAMNVLFAIGAYTGLTAYFGVPVPDENVTVGAVRLAQLPVGAESLQVIRPGDRIVGVGDDSIHTWIELQDAFLRNDALPLPLHVTGRTTPILLDIPLSNQQARSDAFGALMEMHPPVAGFVTPGGPAERAGMREGDHLLKVNGDTILSWEAMVRVIEQSAGETLGVTLGRAGQRLDIAVVPRAERVRADSGRTRVVGRVGMGYVIERQRVGIAGALREGVRQSVRAGGQVLFVLRGMLTGKLSPRDLGGPILIGQISGQMARLGPGMLIQFMAALSMNLAILNLLPIPVLDGGHVVFLLVEAVRRKPVSMVVRQRLTTAGLVILIMLMVFATANDITRLVQSWF